jgi:hypothetical protein
MRLIAVIFMLGWLSTLHSQNKILKGSVVEENGNVPVIGALVYNTLSKQLSVTDFYGLFELEVSESNPTQLYVKYTGFNPVISVFNPESDSILIKLPSPPYTGIVIVDIRSNNVPYPTKADSLSLLYFNKYDCEIDSIYRSKQ